MVTLPGLHYRSDGGYGLSDRFFGHDEGLFVVPEEFDAPLPDGIIADFEGQPQ